MLRARGNCDFPNPPVRVQALQEGRCESSRRKAIVISVIGPRDCKRRERDAARAQGDRQSQGKRGERGLEARSQMRRARAGAAGCSNDVDGAPLKMIVEGKSECLA